MKKVILLIIFGIFSYTVKSQTPIISNTEIHLSQSMDTLIVNYDLSAPKTVDLIKFNITDSLGGSIQTKAVFGDVGKNIVPGQGKLIYWDLNADNFDIYSTPIFASVTGEFYQPRFIPQEKERWIPWLYIASGACAIGGTVAMLRANTLFNTYQSQSNTFQAEQYHKDVNLYTNISNYAYALSGGLAIAGVVVHIKHNQKVNQLQLSYNTTSVGCSIALNYQF
ncbi:MAG: hypothetical protein PF436_08025 [Prolixibacteraceae bacterium]|jgi:hypothetical protein|nr:hypothetical protein [Prolixibacteraceae bacterium]